MLLTINAADALAQLPEFNTLIDARSESEFALDRLPGAVNWPTLTDAERIVIGTEYVQVSAFTAKKRGAALVARNIAGHIEREVLDKPKDWRPLVYCWRGGSRSGSLATVLDQIGFRVYRLEGGYQAYRRAVVAALDELPARFQYRVICGSTGSGKSRLLQVLRAQGAQVLDLEALANHRGSVLGLLPGSPQPGQKQFDSRVWDALQGFDRSRPVYIESESKKVGNLAVPASLIEAMRASPCLRLELADDQRVALLLEDYAFFVSDPELFCERLDALVTLRGREVVALWQAQVRSGDVEPVVRELLLKHYDPGYAASIERNFRQYGSAQAIAPADRSAASMAALAGELMAGAASAAAR